MKNIFSLTVLFFISTLVIAQTKPEPLVKTSVFIDGVLSNLKIKCSELPEAIKQLEKEGKLVAAEGVRDGMYTMCECTPKKLETVRAKLSVIELDTKISESKFGTSIANPIVEQCGSDQLKRTYSEGCSTRYFAKNKKNPEKYCSCMHRGLEQMSNSEIMKGSNDGIEYAAKASEAKKNGMPAPVKPASFQKFFDLDASCSTAQ
ncbi:hypothetical protein [Undibacterium sp. TJN19]|uniref:hypothetical protein n=1 Tax=Undibacterium sp. TJN19 TaxID=3413055 RepID=UPI003BF2C78B